MSSPHAARPPARFVVVDGGARNGLRVLGGLHDRLDVHAFEPDPEACAGLTGTSPGMTLRAWPWALDAQAGQRTLHLARHGSMSSLLPPDMEAYARHFGRMADYPAWAGAIETVASCEVDTIALDDWAARAGVERIHLLKLDTQGTELDILRGATGLLEAGRVCVVYTEISFLPVYRGQALFPELDRFLRAAGFRLIDCDFHPQPRMGHRLGKRYVEPPRWTAVGDAIFAWHPEGWPQADRAALTAATALVLAHLGQPRTAAHWLARHAGWTAADIDAAWPSPTTPGRARRVMAGVTRRLRRR